MAGYGRAAALLVWLGVLLGACSSNGPSGDGIGEAFNPASCQLGVDKSVDIKSAVPIAIGEEKTGTICPLRDSDFYKVEHTGSLLKIELSGSVDDTGTPIQLAYTVFDKDGKPVGSSPVWDGAGIRKFNDFHCLQQGTYYIQVKDDGDDDKDGTNLYHLKVGSGQDKDGGEPGNNLPAGAKPPGTGYISCKGDVDWFSFSVGADQLAEVTLKTAAATSLALKYTIYDSTGKNKLAEDAAPGNSQNPINMLTLRALPKPGQYLIAVEESAGRSDPETSYTLAVTPKAEPDPQDRGARNDTPATATDCGSGCSKQGRIASKADVDYYRVDIPGVSATNIGVIDISVDFGGNSKVDPQISLIYGDELTPCTKDACCRVLSGTCNSSEIDCKRRTYNCIERGDIYCSDADCKPPASCSSQKSCAGAVVCLPSGRCGGEQFSRNDDNGEKDGARVRTAQPLLHPGPWYVRVADLASDEWDYDRGYTVNIQVRLDPDGSKELNSEYFPNQVTSSVNTYEWHKQQATPAAFPGQFSGYISYQGDWDWYKIPHPCPSAPNKECTLTVNYSTSGDCSGVQPVYQLHKKDGDPWFAWPANGQPLSGNPGCVYVNGSSDTYYFTVSDFKHDGWSWSCQYHVTVSVTPGCQPPCKVSSGNCDAP